MAARSSMAALITRTRGLVGDPAGDGQLLSDDEIQDALDDRRTDVVEAALRSRTSFDDGGILVYADWFAPRAPWEDSVVLRNGSGDVLTATSEDLTRAHWTFTGGQAPPVYVTGSYFDLYGSAVSLLQEMAAKVAQQFDFRTDGQAFDRSQKRHGLLEVAREYARRAIQPGARPASRSSDW